MRCLCAVPKSLPGTRLPPTRAGNQCRRELPAGRRCCYDRRIDITTPVCNAIGFSHPTLPSAHYRKFSSPLPSSMGSDPALYAMTRRRGTLLLDTRRFPRLPAGEAGRQEGFTKTCSIAFPAAIVSGGLLCCGPRRCYSTSTPRRIIDGVRASSRSFNHCIIRSQLNINLCKVPSLCECVDVSRGAPDWTILTSVEERGKRGGPNLVI